MKNKRNLNTKWLLLQNDQNADTTLLHSHDEMSLDQRELPRIVWPGKKIQEGMETTDWFIYKVSARPLFRL